MEIGSWHRTRKTIFPSAEINEIHVDINNLIMELIL